jgi:hypothetical protein
MLTRGGIRLDYRFVKFRLILLRAGEGDHIDVRCRWSLFVFGELVDGAVAAVAASLMGASNQPSEHL